VRPLVYSTSVASTAAGVQLTLGVNNGASLMTTALHFNDTVSPVGSTLTAPSTVPGGNVISFTMTPSGSDLAHFFTDPSSPVSITIAAQQPMMFSALPANVWTTPVVSFTLTLGVAPSTSLSVHLIVDIGTLSTLTLRYTRVQTSQAFTWTLRQSASSSSRRRSRRRAITGALRAPDCADQDDAAAGGAHDRHSRDRTVRDVRYYSSEHHYIASAAVGTLQVHLTVDCSGATIAPSTPSFTVPSTSSSLFISPSPSRTMR
jgi:hypothetical protein